VANRGGGGFGYRNTWPAKLKDKIIRKKKIEKKSEKRKKKNGRVPVFLVKAVNAPSAREKKPQSWGRSGGRDGREKQGKGWGQVAEWGGKAAKRSPLKKEEEGWGRKKKKRNVLPWGEREIVSAIRRKKKKVLPGKGGGAPSAEMPVKTTGRRKTARRCAGSKGGKTEEGSQAFFWKDDGYILTWKEKKVAGKKKNIRKKPNS